MKAPVDVTFGWGIVPHVCRNCLGRVVQQGDRYRCSSCGAECAGHPRGICGCGLRPAAKGSGPFRCGTNPARSAVNPSEIIILFGDQPAEVEDAAP